MSYVRIRIAKLEGVLEILQGLPKEVVSKRGGPVKLALRKGALILRDEEKRRLNSLILSKGSDSYSTGLLAANIVASRGKAPTIGKGERILVRIRKKVYVRADSKPTTTLKTAHIMEYGSEKQKATPFIRPAFNAKKEEVLRVVPADLVKRLNKIIKQLGRK